VALINCQECNKEISDKAGACPQCGHPVEKPVLPEPQQHDPDKKVCPSCKSDNTQTIKMMCLGGSSTSASAGVGVTSNLHVGVGIAGSSSQTKLAAKFNPGIKPDNTGLKYIAFGFAAFCIFIGVIALAQNNSGGWVSLFIALIAGVVGQFGPSNDSIADKIAAWEIKKALYENGWICHKCGNTWMP
jgi:hypothetical protein